MGVASHLRIPIDEYDARIRTFIPGYDTMIEAAATALGALPTRTPRLIDLGVGTGALAARCLQLLPDATVMGVDEDPAMLDLAEQRLGSHSSNVAFVQGSFLDLVLPPCEGIVASLAMHHITTMDAKRSMYRRCRAALNAGGMFVSADCFPSSAPRLAALEHDAWRAHLHRSYSAEETEALFAAWAQEDVYFSLADELAMLRDAGFVADVVWRLGPMGVIAAA